MIKERQRQIKQELIGLKSRLIKLQREIFLIKCNMLLLEKELEVNKGGTATAKQ